MILKLALGVAGFLGWSVLWLLEARWREMPAYHRPRFTHHTLYPVWSGALRKAILAAALLALFAVHWGAGGAAVAALLAGWGFRRYLTGPAGLRRGMQRDLDRLRREKPDLSDGEALCHVILIRHRRWGMELAQQIVQENPSIEAAARIVARMERELGR